MSTDYGLKCKQCDKSIIPDNMRLYGIEIALSNMKDLCALGKLYKKLYADVDIKAYWCEDFETFLDWLIKHEDHPLTVIDEYNKEYKHISIDKLSDLFEPNLKHHAHLQRKNNMPAMIRILHTQVVELDNDKRLVLRIQDNGTVDVTVELSETECYGLEIPWHLFMVSMASFIYELKEQG